MERFIRAYKKRTDLEEQKRKREERKREKHKKKVIKTTHKTFQYVLSEIEHRIKNGKPHVIRYIRCIRYSDHHRSLRSERTRRSICYTDDNCFDYDLLVSMLESHEGIEVFQFVDVLGVEYYDLVRMIEAHEKFAPGGMGYENAKNHFEAMCKVSDE